MTSDAQQSTVYKCHEFQCSTYSSFTAYELSSCDVNGPVEKQVLKPEFHCIDLLWICCTASYLPTLQH